MAEITGGEALARCLAQEGVGFVFGLPCPEIDPLLAALEGRGIRFVPVRVTPKSREPILVSVVAVKPMYAFEVLLVI